MPHSRREPCRPPGTQPPAGRSFQSFGRGAARAHLGLARQLAGSDADTQAADACARGAGQQNGAHRVGLYGPKWSLKGSGRDGVSLQNCENVEANEAKERFGTIVLRTDLEIQCSTKCLQGRDVALGLIRERYTVSDVLGTRRQSRHTVRLNRLPKSITKLVSAARLIAKDVGSSLFLLRLANNAPDTVDQPFG